MQRLSQAELSLVSWELVDVFFQVGKKVKIQVLVSIKDVLKENQTFLKKNGFFLKKTSILKKKQKKHDF